MDYRARELIKQGDALFSKRSMMESHWQDTAEQFYPERADFTQEITLGEDLASHLTSSVPILNRRDLGNMFSSMLRPRSLQWFEVSAGHEDDDTPQDAKIWLEEKQITQRNAMYDHVAGFQRATKDADHGYVTFGQWPLKVEINHRDQALLVRSRHLRDVVWCDDFTGKTYKVHERFKPSASQLAGMFQEGKLHKNVIKALKQDPETEFECRQVVLPVEDYERLKPSEDRKSYYRTKFVSVYIDVTNEHVIEEAPSATLKYVIPRWQTIAGSQYSYSQAAIAALPDARLLQAMTLSLLEAGEMYARPPLLAVEEALRGDLNYFAGAVTYISAKYDEKTGAAVRPMTQDKSGFQAGLELLDRTRMTLREAFFLDKVNLPVMEPGVTAFEISQRVEEYIRNAMPLFDPVESEYNAPLCEMIFEEMMDYGFFGRDIPQSLQDSEIRFTFKSPLRDAEEKKKAGAFSQGGELIASALQLDPQAAAMVKTRDALRESLKSVEWPEDWLLSEEETQSILDEAAQKQELQEGIGMMQQGGEALEKVGKAGQAMEGMV